MPGDDVGFISYSAIDAPGGIDSLDFLTVEFGNFGAGKSFSWRIDVDDNPDGSVYGNDLIGALFLVEMSDGLTYQGILEAVVGNSDASQLRIIGVSDTTIDESTEITEPGFIFTFASLMLAFSLRRRKFLS